MRVLDFGRRAVLAGATVAALAACGGAGSTPQLANSLSLHRHGSGSSPIQHVVIIVQENRSFDNLFAGFPGAHGQLHGLAKMKVKGKWVAKKVALVEQPFAARTEQRYRPLLLLLHDGAERWEDGRL